MIKFHGISMPEGAALSWPLSDIVIRRKNGFDFRCRVRGCSLLDQRPVSALPGRLRACRRRTGIHASEPFRTRSASECLGRPEMLSSVCRCSWTSGVAITIEKSPNCWRIFPAGGGSPTTASGRRMVRIGSSAYLKYHRGPGHDALASPGNFKARLCCRFAAEAATDDHRHNFKLRFAASKAVRPP